MSGAKALAVARRSGLLRLFAAAPDDRTRSAVLAVSEAAWNPGWNFSARPLPQFRPVVGLAAAVNGREWAALVLVDPAARTELFLVNRSKALAFAHHEYSRLPGDVQEAAIDDGLLELIRPKFAITGSEIKVSAWDVWGLVRQYARYRLLDAVRAYDAERKDGDGRVVVSTDAAIEAGAAISPVLRCGASTGDEFGESTVEADVWRLAARTLERARPGLLAGTRAGASRERLDLTVRAAVATLRAGAGDELVRATFAQDSLLVCYRALRTVAPSTWGRYPGERVPTREVVERVYAEVRGLGGPDLGFFERVEGRRKELNDSGRLLHGIRHRVEQALREAAHADPAERDRYLVSPGRRTRAPGAA